MSDEGNERQRNRRDQKPKSTTKSTPPTRTCVTPTQFSWGPPTRSSAPVRFIGTSRRLCGHENSGRGCAPCEAAGNGFLEKWADFPALCYTRPRRPRLEFWYAAYPERSCRSAAAYRRTHFLREQRHGPIWKHRSNDTIQSRRNAEEIILIIEPCIMRV